MTGCATSTPFREWVGYVPPTSLPSQPKRTMVQDSPSSVWNHLIAFLQNSDFEIDHADGEKGLIVARYHGSPERYVDCGSIVIHENGALREIPGAVEEVVLNVKQNDLPVLLKRGVSLESRIIIRLQEQNLGTVVSTDTTYTVTKTVDMEPWPQAMAEESHEVISFSAGKRAEFTKGTACQPNGALDVAVLQNLPHVIGSSEVARADLPIDQFGDEDLRLFDQSVGDDVEHLIDPDQWAAGRFDDQQLDAAVLPKGRVADNVESGWTYADPDRSLP
ncbi:MAG: hypothetical protein ACR2QF_07665 [Geminicoccaceae bacterium]